MKCEECKFDYPKNLVQPLKTNKGKVFVCGICALSLSNKFHGIHRYKFDGKVAEEFRQKAIEYRKSILNARTN